MPFDEYEIEVEVSMIKKFKVRAISLNRAKQILEDRFDSGKIDPYSEGEIVSEKWNYD
ncbi:MAG: hypothetical protein IKW81_01380 [Pseudobutyrivibrio sp.]|nr:hypothetical protein [Pseudobutyrivibrio sp.]